MNRSFFSLCILLVLCCIWHISLADIRVPNYMGYDSLTVPFFGELHCYTPSSDEVFTKTFRLELQGNHFESTARVKTISVIITKNDNTLWTNETVLTPIDDNIIDMSKKYFDLPNIQLNCSKNPGFIFQGMITFDNYLSTNALSQLRIKASLFSPGESTSTASGMVQYTNKPISLSHNDIKFNIISPYNIPVSDSSSLFRPYRTTMQIDIPNIQFTELDFLSVLLSPGWQIGLHPDTPQSRCTIQYYENDKDTTTTNINQQPTYIYPAHFYIVNKNEYIIHPRMKTSVFGTSEEYPKFKLGSRLFIECHDIMTSYNKLAIDYITNKPHVYLEVSSTLASSSLSNVISTITTIYDNKYIMIGGTPYISINDISSAKAKVPPSMHRGDSTYMYRYISSQYTLNIPIEQLNIKNLQEYNIDIGINGIKLDNIDESNSIFYAQVSCNDIDTESTGQDIIIYPSLQTLTLNAYDGFKLYQSYDTTTLNGGIISFPLINTKLYNYITQDDLNKCIVKYNDNISQPIGVLHVTINAVIKMKDKNDTTPINDDSPIYGGSNHGLVGTILALRNNNTKNDKSYYTLVATSSASIPYIKSPAGLNVEIVFASETTQKSTMNGIKYRIYNPGRVERRQTDSNTSSLSSTPSSFMIGDRPDIHYPSLPLQLSHDRRTMSIFHSHISYYPHNCDQFEEKTGRDEIFSYVEYYAVCRNAIYESIKKDKLPPLTSKQMLVVVTQPHVITLNSSSSVSSSLYNLKHAISADQPSSAPAIVFTMFDIPTVLEPNPYYKP